MPVKTPQARRERDGDVCPMDVKGPAGSFIGTVQGAEQLVDTAHYLGGGLRPLDVGPDT